VESAKYGSVFLTIINHSTLTHRHDGEKYMKNKIKEAAEQFESEHGERIYYDHVKDKPCVYLCVGSFTAGAEFGLSYLPDITHRNYEATKRRGLIDEKTTFYDFIAKMREEADELEESYNIGRIACEFDPKELADVALVCFAMAEHYGIDLVDEMRKKTEFNEKRED